MLDRARAVAEAQVDLNRVRARRNTLVTQLLAHPEYQPLATYKKQVRIMRMIDRIQGVLGKSFDLDVIDPLIEFKPLKDDKKFATVVEDRIRELAALDRYERRAISKRKSAIRAFDSASMSRSNPKKQERIHHDKLGRGPRSPAPGIKPHGATTTISALTTVE